MPTSSSNSKTVYVWDRFIRSFHWLLVITIGVSALSGYLLGATWLQLHYIAGTIAVTLVISRLFWGGLGPTYARFSSFITSAKNLRHHIDELLTGTAPRHLGHNPLGGLMVLTLLASVIGLGLTGAVALGGVFKIGPLAFVTSFEVGTIVSYGHAFLAGLLMWLIGAHVAGALFESYRTHENLPKSMVTGRKQSRPGDHMASVRSSAPVLMATLLILAVSGASYGLSVLAAKPALGVPNYPLDPRYAAECSECHIAYHPTLLTAPDWKDLMLGLPDHFGEDASLDAATTRELTLWLAAHSAETADTKPAHRLSATNPSHPFSLTETDFWVNTHRSVATETFRRPPVFAKSNCAACHQDAASGRFLPTHVAIPKETQS